KNWKLAFYGEERAWWSPPTKLGVPLIFDLISDPKEEYGATLSPDGWIGGPAMEIVADFEKSLRLHPPIAPGTPGPYTPPKQEPARKGGERRGVIARGHWTLCTRFREVLE